jgi:hypothetical protein
VKCGNPDCENLHGPYLYAYWKQDKKLKKRYVDKYLEDFRFRKLAKQIKLRPSQYIKFGFIQEEANKGNVLARQYLEKLRKEKVSIDWASEIAQTMEEMKVTISENEEYSSTTEYGNFTEVTIVWLLIHLVFGAVLGGVSCSISIRFGSIYRCIKCNISFSRIDSLQKHIQLVHGSSPIQLKRILGGGFGGIEVLKQLVQYERSLVRGILRERKSASFHTKLFKLYFRMSVCIGNSCCRLEFSQLRVWLLIRARP